jgi:hypothetical protein
VPSVGSADLARAESASRESAGAALFRRAVRATYAPLRRGGHASTFDTGPPASKLWRWAQGPPSPGPQHDKAGTRAMPSRISTLAIAERRVAEAELQIARQKTILDAMARGNHSHRVIDQARSTLARFEDSLRFAQDHLRFERQHYGYQ